MTTIEHRLKSVYEMVSEVESACHPGLMMDKLLKGVPEKQEFTGDLARSVVAARGDGAVLKAALARREKTLKALGASIWTQKTVAPMALHLARAALLENANVCLHRTYGFAYLPGSGLKGMARAWAEMVWLPAQPDRTAALRTIDRIFGFADTPARKALVEREPGIVRLRDDETKKPITEHTGTVVFHDAWPTQWPKLAVDVLTTHHGGYYSAKDTVVPPPGDWEGPIPVNFLVIESGTLFHFALSGLGNRATEADLDLARGFLDGALAHRGAGGKTNTGYGYFATTDKSPEAAGGDAFQCELELVTPAFLAGADQFAAEGCDLRGATLRGQLRWWWRTMHAAHLEPRQLRKLEEALWGSSSHGGAIALRIEAKQPGQPVALDRDKLADQKAAKETEIRFRSAKYPQAHSRTRDFKKVTPGLTYLSYGMQEKDGPRWMRLPGATWTLHLVCRPALLERKVDKKVVESLPIPTDYVRREAMAALWLLVNHGGVGSKARKGFGSLHANPSPGNLSIETCKAAAAQTRRAVERFSELRRPQAPRQATPALESLLAFSQPVVLPGATRLHVIQQLGFSLSLFAAGHAHVLNKKALGLPRRVKEQTTGSFRPARPVDDRHASPWHLHIAKAEKGLEVRFTAFPSPWLPNQEESTKWLADLRNHLESDLRLRATSVPSIQEEFRATGTPSRSTTTTASTRYP
jgi:CRISPR-associated protein Cmr6